MFSYSCLVALSNARKLFRVLKFLHEYRTINTLLGKADSMPVHKLILALVPRIAFFFYWIFDTLIVLLKIGFLKNMDAKWLTNKWAGFWTIANAFGIIAGIVELYEVQQEEIKLVAQKKVSA